MAVTRARQDVRRESDWVVLPVENYTYAVNVTRRRWRGRENSAKEKEAQRVTTAFIEAARGDCGYLENRLDGK